MLEGLSALPENRRHCVRCIAFLLSLLTLFTCSRPKQVTTGPAPITVLIWMLGDSYQVDQSLARQFTQQTGIPVRLVPGSESVSRRLPQELDMLEHGSSAVDVFQIDTIWPVIVARHMIDLQPALGSDLEDQLPDVLANAKVDGRLVGAPFFVDYGMLYYRKDLLAKYGYARPPRTWDELERQSARIQAGERRQGHSHFWGYVWQGADYEGLTCNALEWQYSQGGGNFVEGDRTIDVDNPAAIASLKRATHWIGTISPRGVTAYLEEDSRNLWQSGQAAFLRSWSYVYPLAKRSADLGARFAVGPLPAGSNPHASTLGGWYLGVSKYSRHQPDAIAFVKFMTGRKAQKQRAIDGGFLPSVASLYSDPDVVRANPYLPAMHPVSERLVRRPAAVLGLKYDEASRAYASGVHKILRGQMTPEAGVIRLQQNLAHITGFRPRTSSKASSSGATHRPPASPEHT